MCKTTLGVAMCFWIQISFSQPLNNKGTCDESLFTRSPLNWVGGMPPDKRFPQSYQHALTPEQSIKCIETPPGFVAELWASEETGGAIEVPIAFTFDAKGRVWTVESYDYPNDKHPQFQGNDKVIILEDTDGDQVADTKKVFVDNLAMAQGIAFIPEGLIVMAAPYLLLFEDKNNDDIADDPKGKILLTGFATGDTHSGGSNLRFGLDNWIYGNNGISASNITGNFEGQVRVSQGPWRAKRDGSKFEWLGQDGGNNSWALGFSEDGQVFWGSATSSMPLHHNVVANKSYMNIRNGLWKEGPAPHYITEDINHGDSTFKYWPGHKWTATTNAEVYTSKQFPSEFWNRATFQCDGVFHLCGIHFLERKNSTWKAFEDPGKYNIFAGKDAQVAPIMAKVGPDGALWVMDWYTYVYLHNGASPIGPGGGIIVSPNIRLERTARLYRVRYEDKSLMPQHDLSRATPEELVSILGDQTMLWRLEAQKLLIKMGLNPTVEKILTEILQKKASPDPITGVDYQTLHALWTMQDFGVFETNPSKWDPILKNLLVHPSFAVRRSAVLAMPRTAKSAEAIRDQRTLCDTDDHVRIQALFSLQTLPRTSGLQFTNVFKNLDEFSNSVFEPANAIHSISLVNSCTPPDLRPVVVAASLPNKKENIFINIDQMGFLHIVHGEKYSGTLKLYDISGKLISKWTINSGFLGHAKIKDPGVFFYVLDNGIEIEKGRLFNFREL